MMCFRESDGKFLWQIVHEKLPNATQNDNPQTGICSQPVVEGKRLYYVSNRCELVCAETEGDPAAPGKGKVVWTLDMVKELKVYPCQMSACSPLVVGDLVYAVTANGIDIETGKLPSPQAPSFVAVDKKTGAVKWQSAAPGEKIMEGQWGNPAAAEVNGITQVVFPGGDGWLYAFEAKSGDLLWKFDCNPKGAKPFAPGGRGDRNYLVATPVIVDNKLYIGVGQQPDHGAGIGHLWCIDITKKPAKKDKDLSPVSDNFDPKADVNKDSGLMWHYGGPIVPKPKKGRDYVFGRTMGTVAIHDGLVYASEMDGFLHCLDAKTGEKLWVQDMKDGSWCSPYYVDGKIYIGTETGDVYVFMAGRETKRLQKINMDGAIQMPPVAVNGVLYVNRGNKLYAIAKKG
jgi:outer membrane protein assembly factor BamB